jgi:hypothetical protein
VTPPPSAVDSIAAVAARFEAAAIAKIEWTHETHLAMGAWHIARFGPARALERLRAGIRALNDAHGTINSDTGGYHETITRAYVRLIAAFLQARPAGEEIDASVAALLASPLAARDALLRHYSKPLLFSVAARRGWVEPDLAALP